MRLGTSCPEQGDSTLRWRPSAAETWNPGTLPALLPGGCLPQALYKPTVKHGSRPGMARALLPWGLKGALSLWPFCYLYPGSPRPPHGGWGRWAPSWPGQSMDSSLSISSSWGWHWSHGLRPGTQWVSPRHLRAPCVRPLLPLSSPPSDRCSSCLSFPSHALEPPLGPLFVPEVYTLAGPLMPLSSSCQPLNRGLSLL